MNRSTPFGRRAHVVFFPGGPDRLTAPSSAGITCRPTISRRWYSTLAGRAPASDGGRAPVTVINETAARRFWPGDDPIGKHVWFGSSTGFMDPSRPVEVVGVVGDVKYGEVDQPIGPDFYTSYLQFSYPDTMVMVKGRAATALLPALRSAAAAVDPATTFMT